MHTSPFSNKQPLRDRPFNLKGCYGFFLKKISDSEFLTYNLMLNSGKKFRASRYIKNKYSNSCVVRKKNSEGCTK